MPKRETRTGFPFKLHALGVLPVAEKGFQVSTYMVISVSCDATTELAKEGRRQVLLGLVSFMVVRAPADEPRLHSGRVKAFVMGPPFVLLGSDIAISVDIAPAGGDVVSIDKPVLARLLVRQRNRESR